MSMTIKYRVRHLHCYSVSVTVTVSYRRCQLPRQAGAEKAYTNEKKSISHVVSTCPKVTARI